ncbi:ABC transporter ATP-binding protein [Paenibacillus chitinolyticus]|uniref:ABC transporter ATP-binding protein n=1 Tax=Paenibacillus chitinolyticus TaxID=79263 RepID=UPI0036D7C175
MNGIKWGYKYAKKIKKSYFVSLIFLILMSVSNLGMIGTQKWIIDYLLIQGKYNLLVLIILSFVLSILFYYVFQTISQLLLVKNELSVRKALTNDLMNYYSNISTEQYKNGRIADFTNYFTNDVTRAANTISNYIPKGVQNIINMIMLFVLIFYSNPLIAFIVVSFGAIYIAVGRKFSRVIKKASEELQVERVKFVTHIEESISASREIIANHNMKWSINLFKTNADQYLHKNLNETKIMNKSAFSSDIIKWGLTLIVLGYGGYLVMNGSLTIGTYIILFHFTTQLMQSMHSVYDFFINLASKSTYLDRLKNIIEFETVSEGITSIADQEIRSIEFRNIDFSYGKDQKMVLKNLSFVIPQGKKIAFVGSSGGGKSTVIQLLAKFYNPIEGSILLNDISYETISKESLLSKIAIVFQEPYIFPDSIRNNIKLGREISDKDMEYICKKVYAHEFIDNLPEKYDTILGEKGIDLSGGQRQRISIARALVNSPEILILDEATSALDLETERKVQKAIDDTRVGLTTITVAHRISTILNSDIIFVMKEGTVVAQGTHKLLTHTSEDYRELLKNEALN